MNKRGQFFLVAAIIIVGMVIGLAAIVNTAKTNPEDETFESLSKEISYETKQVIDYGVYNNLPVEDLTTSFLANYSLSLADEEALFIFGQKSDPKALFFSGSENVGSVSLGSPGSQVSVSITSAGTSEAEVEISGDEAKVNINNIDYSFKMKEGENFHAIIIKNEGGERIVAQE